MGSILQEYQRKFPQSADLFRQGKAVIAGGGHQSRVVRPFPITVDTARAGLKWDVDGNKLIDFVIGYGALILGHARQEIVDAVSKQMSEGTNMATSTKQELRWAQAVQRLMPSVERVRFTASGTEATMLSIRIARAYTGKSKIVKFHEHFHGWHDYVGLESGLITLSGIPEQTLSTVIVAKPDLRQLNKLLSTDDDIAAVILEPTGGHYGEFPLTNPYFLDGLRDVTSRHNVLMIMDEVITAFRLSRGGAQAKYNVNPDLTTMAKIVSGGLPGGSVGGKAEFMDLIGSENDDRHIAHPGTWNANPLSAIAGLTALEIIEREPINQRADALAARLKEGLNEQYSKLEVEGHAHGVSSIVHVTFGVPCDCDRETCTLPHDTLEKAKMPARIQALRLSMLTNGVDMMGGIGFMVSSAHQESDIDHTIESFGKSLKALRDEELI